MHDRTEIIVVTGLPRSGTSMCMRMLKAGGIRLLTDDVRQPDVDNPNGYYEFEPVKQTSRDRSWLSHAQGKAVKLVYRLVYDLPSDLNYRVLFMRRNLDEILASQRKMLERQGRHESSADQETMRDIFARELRQFGAWAERQANLRVLEVNYNRLLSNATPVVNEINEFLGGELSIREMERVVDPLLYRNRCEPSPAL